MMGKGADAQLLLKVAHLGLALGASAKAVAFVAALRRCKLDIVGLGYLPTNLFQYPACLFSPCHGHYSNLNINVSSTNSKQSKLCVKCTLYIDTRLFGKHAVRRNRPEYVYDEIVKASVS